MTRLAHPGEVADLVPSVAAHAAVVDVHGEAVVVDETRGHLHLLNASGALVWSLLDGVSSVGEISADLADAVGAPYDTVNADVGALVLRLLDADLATAPGYRRPPMPDEFVECECGAVHGPGDVDRIEIAANP